MVPRGRPQAAARHPQDPVPTPSTNTLPPIVVLRGMTLLPGVVMKNPGHLKVLELHFLGKILKRWQYKMNYTNHREQKIDKSAGKKISKKNLQKKVEKKARTKKFTNYTETNTSRPTLWN
jgi:hypothetical protein